MKKQTSLTIIACVSLVIILVAFSIAYFSGVGKNVGDIMDSSARREGQPKEGVIFITPDLTALAGELSGTVESKAAAKSAFDLINQQRAAAGLSALKWSNGLEMSSDVRAVEASQVWSHNRPDGSDYWTVDPNLVYGENLAKGFANANDAFKAWMDSPTHRDNIMFADFRTGSISVHILNGVWYWACEFGY